METPVFKGIMTRDSYLFLSARAGHENVTLYLPHYRRRFSRITRFDV
jgi:hypothetical protein